jgi:hypothetical protein
VPQRQTSQEQPAQPPAVGANIQTVVAAGALGLFATVVLTALYGPAETSERAFRLLHWWKRNPEPAPDEPPAPARLSARRK